VDYARKNAERAGVGLRCYNVDWLDLSVPNHYSAVLCVGNSLTYLFEKQKQMKDLSNLSSQLQGGGTFIIDERNYQYMFDTKRNMPDDFEYFGKYKLSQDDVRLTPIFIKNGEVGMRARSQESGNTLDMKFYSFKRNELLGLLRETGFRAIEQFSDYEPGFNAYADFYQYVCTK